jgi:hypothetical protein
MFIAVATQHPRIGAALIAAQPDKWQKSVHGDASEIRTTRI